MFIWGRKIRIWLIQLRHFSYVTQLAKGGAGYLVGSWEKFSGFSHESAYCIGSLLEVLSCLYLAQSTACPGDHFSTRVTP